ncbi:MAG: hypothetical protein ABSB74_00800 [Tepidisphaeraceae bacterium]
MRKHMVLWPVIGAWTLVLAVVSRPSMACLRDTLDDRAVQWSKLIVVAKLSRIHRPVPLTPPATPPADDSPSLSVTSLQLYDFEVTAALDGTKKPGDSVSIIRFLMEPDTQANSVCGQQLTTAQIDKSFLLLLRPEADLRWSDSKIRPDPRTTQVHNLKAFAVVHLESMDDLGAEGLADAKYTISSTRQAEAQFSADDAKVQVQTLINAADDTELDQAEHALLEMGPKSLHMLNHALSAVNDVGRARLQKVIDAVSPPTITAAMESH